MESESALEGTTRAVVLDPPAGVDVEGPVVPRHPQGHSDLAPMRREHLPGTVVESDAVGRLLEVTLHRLEQPRRGLVGLGNTRPGRHTGESVRRTRARTRSVAYSNPLGATRSRPARARAGTGCCPRPRRPLVPSRCPSASRTRRRTLPEDIDESSHASRTRLRSSSRVERARGRPHCSLGGIAPTMRGSPPPAPGKGRRRRGALLRRHVHAGPACLEDDRVGQARRGAGVRCRVGLGFTRALAGVLHDVRARRGEHRTRAPRPVRHQPRDPRCHGDRQRHGHPARGLAAGGWTSGWDAGTAPGA